MIQYRFNPDLKILFAKGFGVVSLIDLLKYGREVLGLPNDLTGSIEYVDLSEATDIAVSYQSAQEMIEVYKGWMARGIKASVLYAPSTFSYGMARMMSSVVSSVLGKPGGGPIVTRTPVSPEDLHAWLADRNETD